jgi:hypothetical protein
MTLALSKNLENHVAAIALRVACFNLCWRMRDNDGRRMQLTLAMQAGVVRTLWKIEDLYDNVMA